MVAADQNPKKLSAWTLGILILIVLLAAGLRFFKVGQHPKAMYGDGLTLVYDAYSILKTGHSQKGEFMPLTFSLGGGRPGGYVYATVPFVALFGPTALASLMVSVFSGLGIVVLLFLLGRLLFSTTTGLCMAFLAGLNPWEISLSRGPFETHLALFLTLLGIYAFFKGLKNSLWFLLFGAAFAFSVQTYPIYRLIIPLISSWLVIWGKLYKKLYQVPVFIAFILIFASSGLGLYQTISRGAQDRFGTINLLSNTELRRDILIKIQDERFLDSLPSDVGKLLHWPQVEVATYWLENYVGNFLPNFLFMHGDEQPRHNPAEMGEFFWVDALYLLLGVVFLYKSNKQLLSLLAGWILIAPFATSLVGEPHALRSSFLLPALLILMGVGLSKLLSVPKTIVRLQVLAVGLIFIIQLVVFIDRFFFVSPQKHARFWSLPAKEASLLALKNLQKFDFIILSNDIDNMEFAYPTYARIDPQAVIEQNLSPAKVGEYSFFKYGNVYIGSLPHTRIKQFIKDLPGSALYIGSDKEQEYLEYYKLIRGPRQQVDLVVMPKSNEANLDLKNQI